MAWGIEGWFFEHSDSQRSDTELTRDIISEILNQTWVEISFTLPELDPRWPEMRSTHINTETFNIDEWEDNPETPNFADLRFSEIRDEATKRRLAWDIQRILSSFTPGILEQYGIKNIIWVQQIYDPTPWKPAYLSWVVIWNTIYITPNSWNTLQHEIFHIIDYSLEGDNNNLNAWVSETLALKNAFWQHTKRAFSELKWELELTHEYVWYNWVTLTEVPQGFISRYSVSSANEDQAEVFAYMKSWDKNEEWLTIWEKAKMDPILQRKIEEMRRNVPNVTFTEK